MIIVNLIGGLGNQMFQYACGCALGRDSGATVKVARDMVDRYTRNNRPELSQVFSTSAAVAGFRDMEDILGSWRARPKVRRWLGHDVLKLLRGRQFIMEQEFQYNSELRDLLGCDLYLQGYWQSERYFEKHADALRKEFSFKNAPTGRNAELARQIRQDVSVGLHIRRGDYANCPKTLAYHGLCEPEYYFRAIEFMHEHVPKFRLFAFSDDPQWVAGTLKPRYPEMVVVDHNQGDQSHNDMLLMSLCDHHIIANSSFSWWGAWLNPDPNKIVIAPRKWFANGPDTADLIPENWVRL
ncbi:MAG: alpha-1,2-fucosyltransferase [Gammaproteobacteria bacterium]|nr:MAG: alpha-1,2-fucosyltransferase [Gammaproteobacteria bacterium]